MERKLMIKVLDRRHHADRGRGRSGEFARCEGEKEERPKFRGAADFGVVSKGLRRHYVREKNGEWKKLKDLDDSEDDVEDDVKTGKLFGGPLPPLPRQTGGKGGGQGGRKGKRVADETGDEDREAEDVFSKRRPKGRGKAIQVPPGKRDDTGDADELFPA
jgi:hypothetical protein